MSEEILNLPPGRELDALVAEKVMGWSDFLRLTDGFPMIVLGHSPSSTIENNHYSVPYYSTDIAAAWEVVGKMERLGFWCQMRTPFGDSDINDGHWAGFTPHRASGWNGRPDYWTSSETLPLSICRAALDALAAQAEREKDEQP